MEQKDYYKILGVESDADSGKIKEAYRKLAFKYHPDRNRENPGNSEKMKSVNEAYAVLSNPEKRKEYEALKRQYGSSAYHHFRNNYSEKDIFSGSDIFHIFDEMTKAFGFRNPDEIFKEFYGRGYQSFEFKRPGFFAKGYFFFGGFPGGQKPAQMELPLKGTLGKLTGYVMGQITGSRIPVTGSHINETITLTPDEAEKGGPYAWFFKNQSKKLVVKIPPGIREGQKIRLTGLGEKGKGGGKPGDLYLQVKIKKPLLKKMKKFLTGLTR